jgi:uncharacterized protein YnzC (UPF0291/DUF896 family)
LLLRDILNGQKQIFSTKTKPKEKISPTDIKKISGHSDEKMFKYYVNSLRDEVKEEFQTMGAFMGKGEFIGPKGGKLKKDKVEDKVEMLLNKRKSGVITEDEFKKQMIVLKGIKLNLRKMYLFT